MTRKNPKTKQKTRAPWKVSMEAIVAGAVDHDDIEPVAMECARIATEGLAAIYTQSKAEAKARGQMDITPTWTEIMPSLIDSLLDWAGGELTKEQKRINAQIVKCGELADDVLAGKFKDVA